MELKDWYELAKALVTIGTLIFTAIQALLLRKQMKKEHEKRRRENTVDVMYNWCNSLEKTPVWPLMLRSSSVHRSVKAFITKILLKSLMISKMIFVGFVDLHRIAKINPVTTVNWRNPTKTVSGSLTGEYCVNCGGMSFLI